MQKISTAPAQPEFDDHDYFTYASIVGLMANTLRRSEPQVFAYCARALDTSACVSLRGLSYLGYLLSNDEDASEPQRGMAAQAIAESTALIATLLDMQYAADCDQSIADAKRP